MVPFRSKLAVALPLGHGPQPPSGFFDLKLELDGALEIDCPNITERGQIGGFGKGFVGIESDVDLDMVAVYTVTGRGWAGVNAHGAGLPSTAHTIAATIVTSVRREIY